MAGLDSDGELAQSVDELKDEVRVLRESVDELREVIDHLTRQIPHDFWQELHGEFGVERKPSRHSQRRLGWMRTVQFKPK